MKALIATYNIHRAVGGDGRCDVGRIAEVAHELAADVLGLQEVDCYATGEDGDAARDHLKILADRLGMHAVPAPLVRRERVGIGLGLLSRHPVVDQRWIDLSFGGGREPRGALDVTIDAPWGELRVLNTHFGLRADERAFQAERLAAHVGAAGSAVIVGDFNEWRWRAPALRPLRTLFDSGPSVRSFPARRPLFALDRIFVRGAGRIDSLQVIATQTARSASDHLPVRAILDVDAPPSPVL